MLPRVLAALGLVLAPCLAHAQQASNTTTNSLRVWHRDDGGATVAGEARGRAPIAEGERFYLYQHSILNIVVLDANPFLFTYASKKGPSTPSPNQQNAEAFAKAVGSLIGMLPKAATAGQAAPEMTVIETLEVTKLRADIEQIDGWLAGLPGLLDESLQVHGESEAQYKAAAAAFQQRRFAGWSDVLDRTDANLVVLGNIATKCTNPEATLSTEPALEGGGSLACGSLSIQSVLAPLTNYSQTLKERVRILRSVYDDGQKMAPFKAAPVAFESTDTSMTVDVAPNIKYAEYLSAGARRAQAAHAKPLLVPLRAYTNWIISPGPGVVYSLVKNPTFSVVPENGKFRVVEKAEKVNAYTAGAILNLQHRKWIDPGFSASIQIGVTPTKDQIGLLAGAGFVLADKVTFGGGFIRQQIRKLADDVGPLLDSPDLLKTATGWGNGGYFMVTYKP